jgi:hypothetical protein
LTPGATDPSSAWPGRPARRRHRAPLGGHVPTTSVLAPRRHERRLTRVDADADAATEHSYWNYDAETNHIHHTGGMGTYDDEFRRTSDGWRLSRQISWLG